MGHSCPGFYMIIYDAQADACLSVHFSLSQGEKNSKFFFLSALLTTLQPILVFVLIKDKVRHEKI